jgi:acetate CoA/acetoacetate CoA-transferase alpha subunit
MIEKPVITAVEASGLVKEGSCLMVGGFMNCGAPLTLLSALHDRGTKNLTLIANDTAVHDLKSGLVTGLGHLVQAKVFKRIVASHIGTNQETQRQLNAGETEVELVPQGTLAEQIRAGGAGLGGFLTPTGLGTEAALGKQTLHVGHKPYLLELPLKADVGFIKAKRADKAGNLVFHGTARNFNPLMATAATLVIAEVEQIVEIGEIDPDDVHTSSIFVDYLVLAEKLDW